MHLLMHMPQMLRVFLFITIISHFGVTQALGAAPLFGNLFKDSTIYFGNPVPSVPLPSDKLRLFVWNIHKGNDERLPQDFSDLAYGADVVLFQETVSNRPFTSAISTANPELGWAMAKAFQQFDFSYTGVATGARVKPSREEVVLSKVTEPITETPKTILLSEFPLENSPKTLLIANIHAINFVGLENYKVQIQQLLEKIRLHQGPLIVAGDFNTWDPARLRYLQTVFAPLGLQRLNTPVAGLLDLDHIFVRELKARFIFDLSHIDSSDHAPLMVDLVFELNQVMMYEAN